MELLITKNGSRTAFIYKGIRIEVDQFTELSVPNKLGGKYYIADASIKDATMHIDGQLYPASVMDHLVIEQAMEDLDQRSFGKTTCPDEWK
jgi:hypothetical protein